MVDDDLILPLSDDEYVLKGSELPNKHVINFQIYSYKMQSINQSIIVFENTAGFAVGGNRLLRRRTRAESDCDVGQSEGAAAGVGVGQREGGGEDRRVHA